MLRLSAAGLHPQGRCKINTPASYSVDSQWQLEEVSHMMHLFRVLCVHTGLKKKKKSPCNWKNYFFSPLFFSLG